MKVFVAYGYNERDKWVGDMAIPVIEALGLEVVHGKEIAGKRLSDEIKNRIKSCDLLVGFLTLRDDDTGGGHWVRAELDTANAVGVPFIPVVENGVDFHANILGDVVWMPYEEKKRDKFLVELIQAVAMEARTFAAVPKQKTILYKFEPDNFYRRIRELNAANCLYECFYRLSNSIGDQYTMQESSWQPERIVAIPGGLGINIDMKYLPFPEHTERAAVEVKVKYGEELWTSEPYQLSRRPIITMERLK